MRNYRRGLVVLLAAVASVTLACRLGFWQLDRAAQKVALHDALEARATLPVVGAAGLARSAEAAALQQYRTASVTGRWLPERTVFLDNRQMDGKVGFYVATPLALDGDAGVVVVQRGWVARHFDNRLALPSVASSPGPIVVVGSIAPAPSRLFEFAGAASGPIRQNLELDAFSRETGLALLPLTILQRDAAGAPPDGLLRHWPLPASDVQKHYGYAFQWFAIAIGIAVLYVWHRFIRPAKRRPEVG